MSTHVLARQWRPKTFSQLVGQTHVQQALINALTQDRLHHAYLFTGTRGVGKTTIARIFAKALNCEQGVSAEPCGQCPTCLAIDSGHFVDLIEVDAASRTKVEDTRELLDNVQYAPTRGRFKVYLIDEVHMLSGHSFNALLKTLEEPPEHVKFLLATTDPQKLPVTVLSRCLQFHLKNMLPEQISAHLSTVLNAENIPFEAPALDYIAQAANGSMRDGLSLLDQAIAYTQQNISAAAIRDMLGFIDQQHITTILQALKQADGQRIVDLCQQLAIDGADFQLTLEDVISRLHQIAVAQVLTHQTPEIDFSAEDTQLFYQIALTGRRDLPLAPTPRIGFEMTLLRMLAFIPASKTPTQPTRHQPVATQTTATATAPVTSDDFNWQQFITNAKLDGMTRALAQHSQCDAIKDGKISLTLDAQQAPLLNDNLKNRLQEALSVYLQSKIKVDYRIAECAVDTPAKHQAQIDQAKLNSAKQSLAQDPQLQALSEQFGATVVADSVKPIDN